MTDTPDHIDNTIRTLMAERSGSERIVMACSMFDAARKMILASLPKDAPAEEIARLLLARTYPELTQD